MTAELHNKVISYRLIVSERQRGVAARCLGGRSFERNNKKMVV